MTEPEPGRPDSELRELGVHFSELAQALSVQSQVHQEDLGNLESALSSSRQIGTDIGILMAREYVTSQQAFELFRQASQQLNRKLRDIAAEVELIGELPPVPSRDRAHPGPREPAAGAGSS